MTLEELKKLVAGGEDDRVEFKETTGHWPYRPRLRKGASRSAPASTKIEALSILCLLDFHGDSPRRFLKGKAEARCGS